MHPLRVVAETWRRDPCASPGRHRMPEIGGCGLCSESGEIAPFVKATADVLCRLRQRMLAALSMRAPAVEGRNGETPAHGRFGLQRACTRARGN